MWNSDIIIKVLQNKTQQRNTKNPTSKSEGADLLVEKLLVISAPEQSKPFSSSLSRIDFNQEETSDQETNLKIKQ